MHLHTAIHKLVHTNKHTHAQHTHIHKHPHKHNTGESVQKKSRCYTKCLQEAIRATHRFATPKITKISSKGGRDQKRQHYIQERVSYKNKSLRPQASTRIKRFLLN